MDLEIVIESIIGEKETKDLLKRLSAISMLNDGEEYETIIERGLTTYLAQRMKPLYKNYKTIYIPLEKGKKISALSIRLEELGKKSRQNGKYGMPNNLEKIFSEVGESYVAKNIISSATDLVIITLNSIISSDKNRQKAKKYLKALEESNFLYMMFQIAVKVIGEDLYKKNFKTANETLNYMSEMIVRDKKEISNMFKQAFENNTEDVSSAVSEYYDRLSYYFDDFVQRNHLVTGEAMERMGKENETVKQLKEDNILMFIGYILGEIKNNLAINEYRLFNDPLITKK